jgi:hypothetical protein
VSNEIVAKKGKLSNNEEVSDASDDEQLSEENEFLRD